MHPQSPIVENSSQQKRGRWPPCDDLLLWKHRYSVDDDMKMLQQHNGRTESAIKGRLKNLSDPGHKAHAALQAALQGKGSCTKATTTTAAAVKVAATTIAVDGGFSGWCAV